VNILIKSAWSFGPIPTHTQNHSLLIKGNFRILSLNYHVGMLLIKEQEMQQSALALWILSLQQHIDCGVFVPSLLDQRNYSSGGGMGDAAAGCDLPLTGCKDGGDPSAVTPRPTGNHTLLLYPTTVINLS
jgi:hypothetical protein